MHVTNNIKNTNGVRSVIFNKKKLYNKQLHKLQTLLS